MDTFFLFRIGVRKHTFEHIEHTMLCDMKWKNCKNNEKLWPQLWCVCFLWCYAHYFAPHSPLVPGGWFCRLWMVLRFIPSFSIESNALNAFSARLILGVRVVGGRHRSPPKKSISSFELEGAKVIKRLRSSCSLRRPLETSRSIISLCFKRQQNGSWSVGKIQFGNLSCLRVLFR